MLLAFRSAEQPLLVRLSLLMADPVTQSLSDTEPTCFWFEALDNSQSESLLTGEESADLVVIGGGYTGLWTALLAKERDPKRDVVLLEADSVGSQASGRNGGFCDASLTHGLANGIAHFSDELHILEELGRSNLDEIEQTISRYDIDCEFERSGAIDVATAQWQLAQLRELVELGQEFGVAVNLLDQNAVRAELDSPTYFGGALYEDSVALIHPVKLVMGLKAACVKLGVRIYEQTPVTGIASVTNGLRIKTPLGNVDARKVALATGVSSDVLRRLRLYVVPIYDYALVTEPLSANQLSAIGWKRRRGFADCGNQFHYYRLTADNRILWGGWDAVYFFGNKVKSELEQSPQTTLKLATNFFETFPQLEGLRFTNSWGGAIDTCSRFCAFWGTAYREKLAYCTGYTGLGVAATRFGAATLLDLLDGETTERTGLRLTKSKPLPFPPEPLRWPIVEITRRSLVRADHNDGKRNLWLRLLDRLGVGFNT